MQKPVHRPLHRCLRPLFGSTVEIAVSAPAALAGPGLARALGVMETIAQQIDFFDPHSDLSRINLHAHRRPVSVNPSIYKLLCLARHLARSSAGLFDFTEGGRLVREGRLPDHGFPQPKARLDGKAGWEAIELLPRLRVRLKRPLVLTLDGLGRGFAVDEAVRALLELGITRGAVSAGRNLRLFGPDALPISVHEDGQASTALGVWGNTALATTGIGFGIEDGRLPSCMLNPEGCDGPACPHFHRCPRAWTIEARESWRASALTQVASRAQANEREARISRLGGRLLQGLEDGNRVVFQPRPS